MASLKIGDDLRNLINGLITTITSPLSTKVNNNSSDITKIQNDISNRFKWKTNTEYQIGIWGDSTPVYRKVFQFNVYKNTTKVISTGLSNAHLINAYGTMRGNNFTIPINFYNSSWTFTHFDEKGTSITCANQFEDSVVTVIIEYVKN